MSNELISLLRPSSPKTNYRLSSAVTRGRGNEESKYLMGRDLRTSTVEAHDNEEHSMMFDAQNAKGLEASG
jgi:hypothetical protein